MSNYISGFCGIGCHEGTKPRNFRETPLPTCTNIESCSCECHKAFNAMFEQTGMDRIAVDNSGYVPDHSQLVLPDRAEVVNEQLAADETVIIVEAEDPIYTPKMVIRTFAETPSGRAARGELEQHVNQVCAAWAIDRQPSLCTTGYVSGEIAKTFGIKAPSIGAIGAVFDRWAAIGYAMFERKPVRFSGFSPEGLEIGLEGCRARHKPKSKRSKS